MRSAAAATALGVTLAVAGLASCAGPSGPVESPGPDPSVTPVFASDEEALAAAEGAYDAYLDVTNDIGKSGWLDLRHLEDVSRAEAFEEYAQSAEELADDGYRQTGDSVFDSLTLQQWRATDVVVITVYLCLDVTHVDVLDAHGESVVAEERPNRQGREVDVDNVDGEWKVSRSEAWSGANFC